jgi:RimJ/RimL family protein N-acetyltransferase
MLLKFVHEIIPHDPITATIEEGNAASEAIAKALGLKKDGPEDPKASRRFIIWRS